MVASMDVSLFPIPYSHEVRQCSRVLNPHLVDGACTWSRRRSAQRAQRAQQVFPQEYGVPGRKGIQDAGTCHGTGRQGCRQEFR